MDGITTAPLVGIDGGGSHTSLIACDSAGRVLARCRAGGINYNAIGMEAARESLREGVARLLSLCGAHDCALLCIGHSALDGPATPEQIQAFAGDTFDASRVRMNSDVHMALMGATLGEPGVMVVSGTGAMVVGRDARGDTHVRGGWGYLLGDEGSCYHIARQGLLEAVRSSERLSPPTALLDAALAHFGVGAPRAIIDALYNPPLAPARLAAFAPRVLTAALADDRAALRVLDDALRVLAALALDAAALCAARCPVWLYGGLFQHNEWVARRFEDMLRRAGDVGRVGAPRLPPEAGAVADALLAEGALTPEAVSALERGCVGEPAPL